MFEDELKSWQWDITNNHDHKLQRQLAESKVKELESEIEEWKRTYKNIEKHNLTTENSLAKVFSSHCPPC